MLQFQVDSDQTANNSFQPDAASRRGLLRRRSLATDTQPWRPVLMRRPSLDVAHALRERAGPAR